MPQCHCAMVPWYHGGMVPCHGAIVPSCHGTMVPWCNGTMVYHGPMIPWCPMVYHGVPMVYRWCTNAVPWCTRSCKKTGQVVLLKTTPRHVRGMDHRGNLGEHLLESLGTRLQEDHSCVDATEESPRGIHIILRPPHEASIDLRPMWPIAVAPKHCRGCLQIEEIVQAPQGDHIQIEKLSLIHI